MNGFHQIGWLIRKDLALQFRTKDTLLLILVFSILVVLIFIFAFGSIFPQAPDERGKLAAKRSGGQPLRLQASLRLTVPSRLSARMAALHGIRLAGIDSGNFYLSKVGEQLDSPNRAGSGCPPSWAAIFGRI